MVANIFPTDPLTPLYQRVHSSKFNFSEHGQDPGVTSSIQARSHTFVEIDHEMISTVILLPSTESFKKGCYQL